MNDSPPPPLPAPPPAYPRGLVKQVQPAALTISQATESGTLYALDEIAGQSAQIGHGGHRVRGSRDPELGARLHFRGKLARFLRLEATAAPDTSGSANRLNQRRIERGGIDLIFFFSY